jgi:hypothetical protein
MIQIAKKLIVFSLAGSLMACAGRAPHPVPVVSATDRLLNCDAIVIEVEANNKKIAALGKESGEKVAQNVAAGLVGLVFFPALFVMDLQGTAEKETAALQTRQQYLATLAETRKCNDPVSFGPAGNK